MSTTADRDLARIVRDEAGAIVTRLHRAIGDFDSAEEAVADAVVEALDAWRHRGVPANPAGWLYTAARHNALDRLRRTANYQIKLERLAALDRSHLEDDPRPDGSAAVLGGRRDERLALLFGCCHPALAADARLALTLRAVVGLTTAEIARATLTPVATVAQRIVRAKRKITSAGIPLRIPTGDELTRRLPAVLLVIYLTYNEAYLATAGPAPTRRDLADDAIWLALLVAEAFADEPEPLGLLALLHLHRAREHARVRDGKLIVLAEQDRSRWDRAEIATARDILERAAAMQRPGPYQLQAAIAACHTEAPNWAATDWPQVLTLYDILVRYDPSPVVRLNRAIARSYAESPRVALTDVDELADALGPYHLYHATRADLLARIGRRADAKVAAAVARSLTANPAERLLLAARYDS